MNERLSGWLISCYIPDHGHKRLLRKGGGFGAGKYLKTNQLTVYHRERGLHRKPVPSWPLDDCQLAQSSLFGSRLYVSEDCWIITFTIK